MASAIDRLAPPHFNFDKPACWPKWIRQYEYYFATVKLDKEDETVQIANLVCSMGPQAAEILNNSTLTVEKKNVLKEVRQMFESHFLGKRNIWFEAFLSRRREQKSGESIMEYANELRSLVANCDYPATVVDWLLTEQFICGVSNAKWREIMLHSEVKELIFSKAIKLCRKKESTVNKAKCMGDRCGEAAAEVKVEVLAVDSTKKLVGPASSTSLNSVIDCKFCARCHIRGNCPAFNVTCYKYGKKGHFRNTCLLKEEQKVVKPQPGAAKAKLVAENSSEDSANEVTAAWLCDRFIDSVCDWGEAGKVEKYRVKLDVLGCLVTFKVDSGADVSIVGDQDVPKNVVMVRHSGRFNASGGHHLVSSLKFTARLAMSMGEIDEDICGRRTESSSIEQKSFCGIRVLEARKRRWFVGERGRKSTSGG